MPVTAEDVRFTYPVQKDERIGAPGLEFKDFITDVEVVDPHTVAFHFSRVYPYQLMDANDGHIVPAHAWGKVPFEKWRTTDFETILVTCGPFRLASHNPQSDAHPGARPELLGQRRARTWTASSLRVIPDIASQLEPTRGGRDPPRPGRAAARGRQAAGTTPSSRLVEYPSRRWGFVAWNNRRAPFADRRVRKALSLAVNRKALVDSRVLRPRQAGGRPGALVDVGVQPKPGAPTVRPGAGPHAARRGRLEGLGRRRNPGSRRQSRFVFDLAYPSANSLRADMAVIIQADLARVGVVCRPQQVEYTALVARLDGGDFDASISAWAEATKVDLTAPWTTPSETQGTSNFMGYSNPEVDRLIAAAREEVDYARAKVLLDRIQEIIVDDQPVTFLYEANDLVGISRRVRGADFNALGIFFNIDEWYWGP